jgi:hypothetical protein
VATGHWSLVTGHWPLATGYWPLVTGHWPLVTGHWSLATGNWPLATGHWPLAILLRFISAEMHPLRLISAEKRRRIVAGRAALVAQLNAGAQARAVTAAKWIVLYILPIGLNGSLNRLHQK